ncbi:hypothetical protein LINPERHAP2_LOCUS12695 [Linum perenne]
MLEYVEQGIPIAMPFAAEVNAVHSGLALTKTHGSDRGGEMPNTRSGTRTEVNARKRTLPQSRNLADKDSDPEAREKEKRS